MCLCTLLAFVTAFPTFAQNAQTYKGVIVDEAEEPIIGASVKVVGTTTGTITDLNGKFVVNVPAGKQVEISYIGYIPQVISNLKQTKIILKEDTKQLDEVVVVGYGTQKKAHLTGAIATVPVDEIQDISSGSLANTLSGLVNGVSVSGGDTRPGETARISIRQNNVLTEMKATNVEPLYVIDGYIYPTEVKVGNVTENLGATAFNNLDPSVIESISVLKDAAAAVYGARAANGVVLVTTKKGNLGAPKISYSGTFGITDEVSRAKMLNAYQYGKLWNAVRAADPTDTSINPLTDLFQADELSTMRGLNYDLLDKYWKAAFTQQHSVNLSGATERASYFAGISFFDQDGNLGKLDYNRWNYRAGVDVKISKWLKANLQVSGDYGKQNKPNVKVGGTNSETDYNLLLMHPRYIPETVDGNPLATYGISNKQVSNSQNYSFSVLQNLGDYNKTMTSNMNINAGLEYDFGWNKWLKGLRLKFTYSKSINTSKNNQYGSSYELYYMADRAGSGSHLYTPVSGQESLYEALLNENNFLLANGGATIYNGDKSYLSRDMNRTDNYQMNFMATYNRDFGDHHVGALFSIERSEAESEYLNGSVTYPYEFTTGQSNSVGAGSEPGTVFTRSESGTLSYIGRINYAYADKYLFEFLLRSDASTKFAPENYWGFFPGISAGWVASEENFFKETMPSWFEYLKVRLSWGQTGKDNLKAWRWKQLYEVDPSRGYGFGANGGVVTSGVKPQATPNRQAHWDRTNKYNLGLDMRFLNNRLSATADFYYDINSDILNQNIGGIIGTPIFAGGAIGEVNYGRIDAWGGEFSLNWRDKVGQVRYNVGVNFGFSNNKVKLWPDMGDNLPSKNTMREGHSTIFPFWGFNVWRGTSTGDGILRTQADIDNYWSYLEANATAAGNSSVEYLGKKNKSELRPGMLAYQDLGGSLNSDGTQKGPDGRVAKDEDYTQLCKKDKTHGFTTKLGAEWKGLSFNMMISTSWGGKRQIDVAQIKTSSKDMVWAPDVFWKDMFDEQYNPMGKYPNLGMENRLSGSVDSPSDFWSISTFRCYIRNLSIGYTLPKAWLAPLKIQSAKLSLTGNNLWDLYNPYPSKYRNMYDATTTLYPTLRTWSLGVNVSF